MLFNMQELDQVLNILFSMPELILDQIMQDQHQDLIMTVTILEDIQ